MWQFCGRQDLTVTFHGKYGNMVGMGGDFYLCISVYIHHLQP